MEFDFSIIISTYNSELGIKKSIDSIINQTHAFSNIEIIIVDNNSDDNTKNICEYYVRKYSHNIKYFQLEENDIVKSINFGIEQSSGTFIASLQPHDYYSKNTLQGIWEFANKNNDVNVISAPIVFFKNNKNWHFTAGFYWGPSQFAMADNTTEAMTSLLGVGIYNRIYDRAELNYPLMEWEDMGISEEIIDKYHLNFIPTELYQQIISYGRLGFTLGTFKRQMVDDDGIARTAGESYNMEPGIDGMIHVKAKSNPFKPYIGFGYGGNLAKGRDDWKICFDAGVWFWGRIKLYTHDGVDLINDVENIGGKVGDYVDFFKGLSVYPTVSVRFTKTLF